MEGFVTTKSAQKTRGERDGGTIVDAGPVLADLLERNGEEIFESEETGKSYVLNERNKKRAAKKALKDSVLHSQLKQPQDIKLEINGTLKPTNINKTATPIPGKDKNATGMLESTQTVQTAIARHNGLKATTQTVATNALKEEKSHVKQLKSEEKKEFKFAKAEEKRRNNDKEQGHAKSIL